MTGRIELRTNLEADPEPSPAFASDAEIKLAERLRRRLEEQYLGSAAESTPPAPSSTQGH